MKYRTKLYLFICAPFLLSVLVLEGLSHLETKKEVIHILQNKAISIAATTAQLIDIDAIIQTKKDLKEGTKAFDQISSTLEKVKLINQKNKISVLYATIIGPNPTNENEIIVYVDSPSTEKTGYAPPGYPYPPQDSKGILAHLKEPYAAGHIIHDQWGRYLPGYVPIFDSQGNYVASAEIDLSASAVHEDFHELLGIAFSTSIIAVAIGLLAATFLALFVTRNLNRIFLGVEQIKKGHLDTRIQVKSNDEFGVLAQSINHMAKGLQEREHLKTNFVRYVSKYILEKILSHEELPSLQGEKKKITLLFSDIRAFTKLSESLPAEEVVSLLNTLLTKMVDVIFEKNGTLDKFIGDGIMVEFGAPLDDPDQENHALDTAIKMQESLKELNQNLAKENKPQFQIVIGIHTGDAIVGNIGSQRRMEYTAIGDTVNVASKIVEAGKKFNAEIVISKTTFEKIKNQDDFEDLGPLEMKGRTDQVRLYRFKGHLP